MGHDLFDVALKSLLDIALDLSDPRSFNLYELEINTFLITLTNMKD